MKKDSIGKMLRITTIMLTLFLCFSPVLAYYPTVTPWPMWRYDSAHTASSPSSAPNSNATLWTASGYYYTPTVAGGRVFVATNYGSISCLDETTGLTLWTSAGYTGSFQGEPMMIGDRLYAGTSSNYMYVLNATNGVKLQEYQATPNYQPTNPIVANGKVYFGSTDGYLYALDANDLTAIWAYHAADGISSSPAVDGTWVYFGCNDGKIYGLNDTGTLPQKKWEFYTGYTGTIGSSPCVANGMVFVGSNSPIHSVFALDETSGASIWNYTLTQGYVIDASPAFSESTVYFTAGTKAYALNANVDPASYSETDPAIRKWSRDLGGTPSDCAIAGDKVVVATRNGLFYALNKTNGLFIWSCTFPNYIYYGSPIVADGRVFVPTWGGGLVCFGDLFPPVTYYYTINAGGVDWNLALTINATPSSTLNGSRLISQKKLSYTLQGIPGTTGMSNISIPIGMLSGPFTSITVDGGLPIYSETTTNDTYSFIYLTYGHSAHTVEIVGSTVVPEFPTLTPLAILMFATMMASLATYHFRRRKTI
jgi:outer membrane protein assembly factor BamB